MIVREATSSIPDGAGGVNLSGILRQESLKSVFQPIFSVKQRKVIGLEALALAHDPANGKRVATPDLFQAATQNGSVLELDRLCRRRALEGFSGLIRLNPGLIAFINIDASVIDEQVVGSNHLINLVRGLELDPRSVALEIVESKIRDHSAMVRFVEAYRELGFLIVLDNIGARRSNLDRISTLKPDIVKLDRTLIAGIEREYHKQVLFDSFVQLAHRFGAMVVAEGIETASEALACLERGADLVQGVHFSGPEPVERLYLYAGLSVVVETDMLLKKQIKAKFAERKSMHARYADIANYICEKLQMYAGSSYDSVLALAIAGFPSVECAYVLQESGMQISSTVFNPKRQHRSRSSLFDPASAGSDQSSKLYFLLVDAAQPQYISEPYVSLATGSLCVTVSTLLKDEEGKNRIVCVDMVKEEKES